MYMLISLTMPLSGAIETVWICHFLSYLSLACFACCLAICSKCCLLSLWFYFAAMSLCCHRNLAASLNAFCK